MLSNDCVIVPGLGGFMAHYVEARYDETDGLFLPPLRTLGFNPQLRLNDHLLVQSYIEAYDISYPEALHRIEEEVNELRQHLDNDGFYEMNDIGILRVNKEGHIVFEPCEAGILTPEFYGFGSFEMLPLSGKAAQSPQVEKKTAEAATARETSPSESQATDSTADILQFEFPDDDNAEAGTSILTSGTDKADDSDAAIVIKMSWIRNAMAVAVAIVAFFLISTPVSNSDLINEGIQQSSLLPMQHKVATAASSQVEQASEPAQDNAPLQAEAEAPKTEPTQEAADGSKEETEPAKSEETSTYVIVLASQTKKSNADAFVERLAKEGFAEAEVKDMWNSKLVRVVYGAYASEEEAQKHLRNLRSKSQDFEEAWIMQTK